MRQGACPRLPRPFRCGIRFPGFEIGFTVIVAAASLRVATACCEGPVSGAEVAARMRPRWPPWIQTHAPTNINEARLVELTHLAPAIFAVPAGWSRRLELRFSGSQRYFPAWIWPLGFVLIRAVLLNYKEA
jgi:hypothetical protein